jgi:H+/Cl- antiporter ClcA
MEMVGDLSLVVPNLVAIFVARSVANQLSQPLYKCQLDAKALPFLDQEPKVVVAGKQ